MASCPTRDDNGWHGDGFAPSDHRTLRPQLSLRLRSLLRKTPVALRPRRFGGGRLENDLALSPHISFARRLQRISKASASSWRFLRLFRIEPHRHGWDPLMALGTLGQMGNFIGERHGERSRKLVMFNGTYEREKRAARYRKVAAEYAGLSKDTTDSFLRSYYLRTVVEYLSRADDELRALEREFGRTSQRRGSAKFCEGVGSVAAAPTTGGQKGP